MITLLCATRGCNSAEQLLRVCPEDVAKLRKVDVATSAAQHLRHILSRCKFPWLLAALGAEGVTPETELAIAWDFCTACEHCIGSLARTLRQKIGANWDDCATTGALSARMKRAFQLWNNEHDVHTFDIECGHGHNKNRSHHLNKWLLIAARSITSGAKAAMPSRESVQVASAPRDNGLHSFYVKI